jgi:hypothetical protein
MFRQVIAIIRGVVVPWKLLRQDMYCNASTNPTTISTHLLVILLRYYKMLGPTIKMKKQCQSCPFAQIKSFKENCGTGNIVNGEFVTHKSAAAEYIRHTYYSTGNITGWGGQILHMN